MAGEENNFSIVAIAIALIAFLITFAQFLLQASSTVGVGRRRCQPSVLGQWAKTRRYKWVWAELRWKITFQTPRFHLCSFHSASEDRPSFLITGDDRSGAMTHSNKVDTLNDEVNERRGVSWIALLDQLHELQSLSQSVAASEVPTRRVLRGGRLTQGEGDFSRTCPAITSHVQSWDSMPPDLVRPVASSTVGDMIIIVHRLGMSWIELRPGEGIMRAEGNGQSMVSISVGGLGTLLKYISDKPTDPQKQWLPRSVTHESNDGAIDLTQAHGAAWSRVTIPTQEADKFGFGIISRCQCFNLPNLMIGESNEIGSVMRALDQLGLDSHMKELSANYMKRTGHIHGFSEVIGMIAPFMPLPGLRVIQILCPHQDVNDSLMRLWEGFQSFLDQLGSPKLKYKISEQMSQVRERCKDLDQMYGRIVHSRSSKNLMSSGTTLDFFHDLRSIWDWTTQYFHLLENKSELSAGSQGFRYINLVGARIAIAAQCSDAVAARREQGVSENRILQIVEGGTLHDASETFGMGTRRWTAQIWQIYIDFLPAIVSDMKRKGFDDKQRVMDAWWTLMLRAICWHQSICFLEREPGSIAVPSSLYGSRIPVFIT